MDRNFDAMQIVVVIMVALRKESVDRNTLFLLFRPGAGVALRKESVDRNSVGKPWVYCSAMSLSARRAWIEIINNNYQDLTRPVALRKESVDRNIWVNKTQSPARGRSPQGERG